MTDSNLTFLNCITPGIILMAQRWIDRWTEIRQEYLTDDRSYVKHTAGWAVEERDYI